MKDFPKVAVIIATFNAAAVVKRAIASVLEQDYQALELIVVDGGSRDGTVAILRDVADPRFSFISEADQGIYDAWNKGVSMTTAQRVLFIGADDRLSTPSSITAFWRNAAAIPAVPVMYGDLVAYGPAGVPIGRAGAPWRSPWTFAGKFLWSSFELPVMATFFDREAIVKAGMFDLRYKIIADIELVLRLSRTSTPQYVSAPPICDMGFGGISTRPETAALVVREAVQVRREHGLGVYTNVEFLWRSSLARLKSLIARYLGQRAAVAFINGLHATRRSLKFWRK